MSFWSKFIDKLHSYWMPYEINYISGHNAQTLKDSPNPLQTWSEWQKENSEQRMDCLEQIRKNERALLLYERFSSFSEHKRKLLESLAKQYSGLRVEKEQAKQGHQDAKEYLQQIGEMKHDEDFPRVLRIIEENELEFRNAQSDLCKLEGEKSALEYEFKRYQIGLSITRIVLFAMIIISILSTVFLFLLSQKQDIFVPAVILIISVGFFSIWSIVFRRYFVSALQKNIRLQQRAVKLLNKIKIKYVTHRNLLDYEYRKFQINSSETLELRYELSLNEKNRRRSFENIRKQYQLVALDIVREMEMLLPEKEEDLVDLFLLDSDFYANATGRERLRSNLQLEKQELARRWQELEDEKNSLQKLRDTI